MRILQQFDPAHEKEFMALERKFAELESARADYPKGRRLQPLASPDPRNTLIWECDFPDLESARAVLCFFAGDAAHEELAARQKRYFKQVRIEFLDMLEM
jgi:hypothetical protein